MDLVSIIQQKTVRNKMSRLRGIVFMVVALGLLAGCTATSTISSVQSGATIDIKESKQSAVPRTESFDATSFGNYEFRAQSAGLEPFYGLLPLKFNGGYLALDILFFAPAAFFNLREVFSFYDFDIEKKVVKYRKKESDEWTIYTPLDSEAARAKTFFLKSAPPPAAAPSPEHP
jgi:hypothetical protein